MSLITRKKRDTQTNSNRIYTKDLYDELHKETNDPRLLVTDWIRHYNLYENEALAAFLLLILQSCGLPKDIISLEDLQSSDMDHLLKKIYDGSKDCEEYPLVSKNKIFKNFPALYHRIFVHLVKESGDKLYDGIMLNFLLNWLSSLSFSSMRPIRHTAVTGVVSLGNALLDLLVKEINDLDKIKRLINSQAYDAKDTVLSDLTEQKAIQTDKTIKLSEHLDSIFKDVIGFRCKDVMNEIRSVSLNCVSHWARGMDSKYLNNSSLKCAGLMLYDKYGDIREKVITFLIKIYTSENQQKLQDFTQKYKLRLLELCFDVENKVCIQALKICTVLTEQNYFNDKEKEVVSNLIWAENEEIRNAACDFIIAGIFHHTLPTETSTSSGLGLEQGKFLDAEKGILLLTDFFIKSSKNQLQLTDPFIKAFWPKTSALRSWEAMCDLLRRGETSRTSELKTPEKIVIINFLISSLKNLQNSPDKKQKNSLVHLSSVLISHLSHFFTFFRTNSEIMIELVKIPQHLDLHALASKDLKTPFLQLVNSLSSLHLQTTDSSICQKTGLSLSKFSKEPHPLQRDSKAELTKLIDVSCLELSKEFRGFTLEGEETALENWLKKIEWLIAYNNITEELGNEVYEDITVLISQFLSNSVDNVNLAKSSVHILFYWHMWSLHTVSQNTDTLEEYKEKRNTIIELFTALTAKNDCEFPLKKDAFKYLCETLMMTSSYAAKDSLVCYDINEDVWGSIEEFMSEIPISTENCIGYVINPNINLDFSKNNQDADVVSQMVCVHIARIICTCPSITKSHLPSSFFANFGISNLKTINIIVKQVLNSLKAIDMKYDSNLLYTIMLESLIKCLGDGSDEDINTMKELAKKFIGSLGTGPLKAKQADRFLIFLLDGIKFALSDKDNFAILEALSFFMGKSYLSQAQTRDLYDKVSKDAEKVIDVLKDGPSKENLSYSLEKFVYFLSKQAGISRQAPIEPIENLEKSKKSRKSLKNHEIMTPPSKRKNKDNIPKLPIEAIEKSNERIPDSIKNLEKPATKSSQRPSRAAKDKARLVSSKNQGSKTGKKRRKRSPFNDEEEGINEPVGRSRKAAIKTK